MSFVYDESRTGTENLYRDMFGEWPKKDLDDGRREILKKILSELFIEKVAEVVDMYYFQSKSVEIEESVHKLILDALSDRLEVIIRGLYDECEDVASFAFWVVLQKMQDERRFAEFKQYIVEGLKLL